MQDLSTTETQRPAPPQTDKPAPKVTRRVRIAIEAMVWQGLQRKAAAEHAGLAEHSLYQALRRHPVRALYLHELEVLRTSERARNIHTLAEVRDQRSNQMARVAAVKALEQLEDQPSAAARGAQSPGFTIVINAAPSAGASAKPLIEHERAMISHDRVAAEAGGKNASD